MQYTPSALRVLRPIGTAQPSPESFVRLGDALLAILNRPVPLPAIAKALRENSVWNSGFRSQRQRTLAGEATFKHVVEMHRGAFVDVHRIDEVVTGLAACENSSVMLERHVAQAMRQVYGKGIDSSLARLGVNADQLVVHVNNLEGAMVGQVSAEPETKLRRIGFEI